MELTPVQKDIVTAPLGACVVTAGAGSGKTRVLTHRIAYLIAEQNIADDCILAMTFTNKAAGEMRRRVEEMTGGACRAYLGTFHSWCARFLRNNIGDPWTSNFTIYDKKDSDKVYKLVGEENIVEYKRHLENNNALDFDDLLEKTLEILTENREVRERLQNQYKYILVDEFQDTNAVQYKIVRILASVHRNIMVVGDEDQCIYTWRGASAENLNAFLRDFPTAKIYKLEQNFRSGGNIVALANKLVNHNINRLDKTLFSELPSGKIRYVSYYDEREEARMIAAQIISEHRQHGTPFGKYAVLMRLNATSRNFEEQFRAFGVPHIIWGGFKFYERAEIKGAINYLRLLVNPRDEIAYTGALTFPKRGIGDAAIDKIKRGEKLTAKAKTGFDEFNRIMDTLRGINDNFGLYDLAGSLISTIGLDAYLIENKDDGEDRLENLYQLEQAMKSFAHENDGATLNDYLQTVALVQDTDGESGDAVVISTIHSAKGLEFENVFIIALEEKVFPLERAVEKAGELEEERRLLYVGITRAMKNLYLSGVQSRFFHGQRGWQSPSRFLYDCDLVKKAKGHGSTSLYQWD